MKSIIQIAILTFLSGNSLSGQHAQHPDKYAVTGVDLLTGIFNGPGSKEVIGWFLSEKIVETDSIFVKGKKLIQVWLPVQTLETVNYEFTYFIN